MRLSAALVVSAGLCLAATSAAASPINYVSTSFISNNGNGCGLTSSSLTSDSAVQTSVPCLASGTTGSASARVGASGQLGVTSELGGYISVGFSVADVE